MGITRTVGPAVRALSLSEAKNHIRYDDSDEDSELLGMMAGVERAVEEYLRRALITQTWQMKLDDFPVWKRTRLDSIIVPRPPLQSVSSIVYLDENGDSQTLSSSVYLVDLVSQPGAIHTAYNQSWPATYDQPNAITATFVAGYGDSPSDIPKDIIHAMKIILGDWYENREGQGGGIPQSAKWLLSPHRCLDERVLEFIT